MDTHSQLARHGLFDARVPRYTSYPTVPHFGTTVGQTAFSEWIESIPAGSAISLYLHVPFCRRLCWFCACRTQGTQSIDPVIAYVQTLKQELALLGQRLAPAITLARLHWGGGTPTMIPPDLIRDLADAIFSLAPLAPDGEFSVEIDPNEVDAPRLDALAAAGMNRASIGVQDFDPEIQRTIGRDQSHDLTRSVVDMIRDRGVHSLNDGYAHVPWMSRRQQMIPPDAIPKPEERLCLFETARRLFTWDGYAEIGIDHFARPGDGLAIAAATGHLRRNFQGYTDDTAPVLIGLGASSISRFPQGYAQNASGTSEHAKAIRAGRFSTRRGHAFAGEDLLRARIIEALMCDFRVSRAELLRDFATTPARLDDLFGAARSRFGDFFEVTAQGAAISAPGRPLTRMIVRTFDEYDHGTARHSAAV